jgi:hypothetical protein
LGIVLLRDLFAFGALLAVVVGDDQSAVGDESVVEGAGSVVIVVYLHKGFESVDGGEETVVTCIYCGLPIK